METISLVLAIAAAAVGATWAIRSKLGELEVALGKHAAEDASNFKALNDNVVQLKSRAKRGRS